MSGVGARAEGTAAPGLRVEPSRSRSVIAVASGVILLGTFLPWGTRFGAAANGWQESSTIVALGDAVASPSVRWLALTWYGIPMAAVSIWLLLAAFPEATRTVRFLAVLVGMLTVVSVLVHVAAGGAPRPMSAGVVGASAVAIFIRASSVRLAPTWRTERRRR